MSDDGAFGGPVAVALAQSEELARRGHEVHLYAAWDGIARVTAPGVTMHLFRVGRPRLGLAAVLSIRLVLMLRRRRSLFDAVHLHFGRDLTSLTAWLAVAHAKKVVLQPHGMVMPDRRIRAAVVDGVVVRRALRAAASVLALTDKETDGLEAVAGRNVNVERIGNGVVVPVRIDPERSGPPVVLFLARLHPRKQVLVFAEAAKLALDSGSTAVFRVIGPDEGDLSALRSFITDNALGSRLAYEGTVGPGEGPVQLGRAALYVLPSIGEVYPMTVLEALAAGTPTILSTDCGLSGDLADARAAVVVDPEPEPIAAAIGSLLADEAERRALVERGHAFARASYSVEAVADRLTDVYTA